MIYYPQKLLLFAHVTYAICGRGHTMDYEESLMIKIAWYYYFENMTQQNVADTLGISRMRVIKDQVFLGLPGDMNPSFSARVAPAYMMQPCASKGRK